MFEREINDSHARMMEHGQNRHVQPSHAWNHPWTHLGTHPPTIVQTTKTVTTITPITFVLTQIRRYSFLAKTKPPNNKGTRTITPREVNSA